MISSHQEWGHGGQGLLQLFALLLDNFKYEPDKERTMSRKRDRQLLYAHQWRVQEKAPLRWANKKKWQWSGSNWGSTHTAAESSHWLTPWIKADSFYISEMSHSRHALTWRASVVCLCEEKNETGHMRRNEEVKRSDGQFVCERVWSVSVMTTDSTAS